MDVKEQLARLEELQTIDLRIREMAKSRDAIPAKIEVLLEESRKRDEEARVIATRLAEVEREKRMLEGNVQDYHQKIQKVQTVQSEIKNQKEYEALLRELDGFKKHKSHYEEEVLRSMELIEELARTKAAAEEAAAQSRKAVEGEVAELQGKMDALSEEMVREDGHRTAVAESVPAQLLKRYDQIRGRRMGIAVVRVQGGVCGGCNMNLPPQFYNVIMRLASIEQCPSCNRILHYRAPEPQPGAG